MNLYSLAWFRFRCVADKESTQAVARDDDLDDYTRAGRARRAGLAWYGCQLTDEVEVDKEYPDIENSGSGCPLLKG